MARGPFVLTAPRDGTPEPITTPAGLTRAAKLLAAGTGPVAVDAERASGYRYTHRAYLVQLRREGAGTILIDPLPFPTCPRSSEAIADAEWVLHAASQDLPCLAEIGLLPTRLFDTELAARLANLERVGLAALTEQLLGFALEKHHSAADWSTRPLPPSWLSYAALDVELLIDLRDKLEAELIAQGKLAWAREEFAALVASAGRPVPPRADPWRRTSGHPQGTRGPGTVPGARALVRPGPGRRPPRHRARPGAARRRDHRRGRGRTRPTSGNCWRCPGSAAGRSAGWRRSGSTRSAEARDLHRPRAAPAARRRRPAAAAPVGRARPGRGRPAGPLPRGGHPDRPRAPAAAGEPDRPGRRPPAGLDAARPARRADRAPSWPDRRRAGSSACWRPDHRGWHDPPPDCQPHAHGSAADRHSSASLSRAACVARAVVGRDTAQA